ncbi:tobe domain protein [Arenibacter aquaticus]|uniref:Tobe domain protein n=1 Tax=Arenibacter aquaticus TaxID=2489054 RepID=A0A430K3L5_9FLAO|nr:TOBE domain-containing protein [Arenibacter aquaticus]RTE53656.1 tobe domain protein [Arenibacter aquaticus]
MNSFPGSIVDIQTSGSISIVGVRVGGCADFFSVVIDTPETAPYLVVGRQVQLLFKETEVVLATDKEGVSNISIENRILGTILIIKRGVLLSRLVLSTQLGEVVAILSEKSVAQLGLKENMEVAVLIKLNEIILAP